MPFNQFYQINHFMLHLLIGHPYVCQLRGKKNLSNEYIYIYLFFEYARIFMKISLFISFYCGFLLLILLLLLRLLIYHLLVICCSFYYCKLLFAVHFLGRRILLRSFMFRTNRRRRKNEDIIQYHSYGNT